MYRIFNIILAFLFLTCNGISGITLYVCSAHPEVVQTECCCADNKTDTDTLEQCPMAMRHTDERPSTHYSSQISQVTAVAEDVIDSSCCQVEQVSQSIISSLSKVIEIAPAPDFENSGNLPFYTAFTAVDHEIEAAIFRDNFSPHPWHPRASTSIPLHLLHCILRN